MNKSTETRNRIHRYQLELPGWIEVLLVKPTITGITPAR